MKKIIVWFFKAMLSGVIAFIGLTLFCFLYYNMPVHYDTLDGATDYSWEANKFYSRATEGFSWGKTNNEGYMNLFDYSNNVEVDTLIIGSSHMEAVQVEMDKSTSALLGKLFPNETIYNIGMSSHNFLVCVDNFDAAINKYKPSKYVLLEASNLKYTDEQLYSAINGIVPHQASYTKGIIGVLQKNPYLRLLYSQLQDFSKGTNYLAGNEKDKNIVCSQSEELYEQVIRKLQKSVSKTGAQLIIVYHPHLFVDEKNQVTVSTDSEVEPFLGDICNRNGVIFLDMSDTFIKQYKERHVLPHGFANTSIGSGHLNKNGHEMIAKAVHAVMEEE